MSYRKKHVKNKIGRIKPKKSVLRKPWFWIVILVLVFIISILYLLLFYSGVQVKNIVISGNQGVANTDIQSFVSENINTKILGSIASSSVFLIDSKKLNKKILNKFPIIESVKVDKGSFQTLTLNIIERKQIGIYCSTDNQCFSIDQNGIIFEPLSAVPENYTIVRQTLENGQISVGKEAIEKNIISIISRVQKDLKDNFKINLKEVVINNPLRMDVTTGENWRIYFDLGPDSDINSQITKLKLLLGGDLSENQRRNLRYIDLRPEDRAVVCDNSVCGG